MADSAAVGPPAAAANYSRGAGNRGISNGDGQLLSAIIAGRGRSRAAAIQLPSVDTAWHSRLGGKETVAALQQYHYVCLQSGIGSMPLIGYANTLGSKAPAYESAEAKEASAEQWLQLFL